MTHSITLHYDTAIVSTHLKSILEETSINQLAYRAGFVKRCTSRIRGFELLKVLVEKALNPKSAPLSICCDAIAQLNPQANISEQALQQRIASPECEKFFEMVFMNQVGPVLKRAWNQLIKERIPMGQGCLSSFNSVLVADSTEFKLQKALKAEFKGTGGEKNSESLLKIMTVHEVKIGVPKLFYICDRRSPDQTLGHHVSKIMQTGDLVLMDAGFFSINTLDQIEEKAGWFITPLNGVADVFKGEGDDRPIDIGRYAAKNIAKNGFLDEILYISHKKKKIRIIALPLTEEAKAKRLRTYYLRCRKDGRKPSEENIARRSVMIWITNIPIEKIPNSLIAKLYSVRWQIELVFKNWKSQLNIHHCPGTNPHRIRVLVLSKLIAILIIGLISIFSKRQLEAFEDKELSMTKVINWLKQVDRFAMLLSLDRDVLQAFQEVSSKRLSKSSCTGRSTTWMDLVTQGAE